MGRPKIAVIHPRLQLGGGSEACVLHILEALKDQYEVTLITSSQISLSAFNSFYGTDIHPEEISVVEVRPPWFLNSAKRFAALRGFRLSRFCKKKSSEYDLMLSAYNQMDFGRKGIQYILDPLFNEQLLRMLNPSPQRWKRWFYRDNIFRKAYLRLGDSLSRFSLEGMKQNLTLVDSDWTGNLTRTALGLETRTLYPPVPEIFPSLRWHEREDGFICIGRIVPEKQIERVIKILQEVRKRESIHLHIIGRIVDQGYAAKLRKLCQDFQQWIFLEEDVPASKKIHLITTHKYGIHGKENEPFGITVAEMVKAGCLVWVPAGGGQVEIVNHPQLVYKNIPDGADKALYVLGSADLQNKLREHLALQSKIFSVKKFRQEVRDIVFRFLREDGKIQK